MVFFTECLTGRKRGQLRDGGEIDYKQAGGFGKMEKTNERSIAQKGDYMRTDNIEILQDTLSILDKDYYVTVEKGKRLN